MELAILTTLVLTLFLVFGITMYREFSRMGKAEYKHNPYDKKYGRDALFEHMENLIKRFDEEKPKKVKKVKNKKRPSNFTTVADMETDGVYFDSSVREIFNEN